MPRRAARCRRSKTASERAAQGRRWRAPSRGHAEESRRGSNAPSFGPPAASKQGQPPDKHPAQSLTLTCLGNLHRSTRGQARAAQTQRCMRSSLEGSPGSGGHARGVERRPGQMRTLTRLIWSHAGPQHFTIPAGHCSRVPPALVRPSDAHPGVRTREQSSAQLRTCPSHHRFTRGAPRQPITVATLHHRPRARISRGRCGPVDALPRMQCGPWPP